MSEENKFENENNAEETAENTVDNSADVTEETAVSPETANEAAEASENAVEETVSAAAEDAETVELTDDAETVELTDDAETVELTDVAESGDAENTEPADAAETVESADDAETVTQVIPDGEADEEIPVKKSKAPVIAAVVAAVVIIAAAIIVVATGKFGEWTNKYNRGYVDTTGRTVAEVAEQIGMTYEEFLEEYGLPKDMPKNTYEAVAFYTMPAKKAADVYGIPFEQIKQMLGLPDDTDENKPWGEVEGEVKLGTYLGGADYVDTFKEQYGLGDEVTADTLWKEVRPIVDAKTKEQREEQEKLAAQSSAEPADGEDNSTASSDAPEETPAAEKAE